MHPYIPILFQAIARICHEPVHVLVTALVCTGFLAGCADAPVSIVQGPLTAAPLPPPANIERVNTGSLFVKGTSGALFSGRRKPHNVGDTLKVDILESYSANSSVNTDSGRESSLKSIGPGGSNSPSSLLQGLLNQNITASGNSSFKGSGTDKSSSSFTGQLAASVVRVLSNGNLVVAGERSIALNGGISTMRFSGIVDPMDLNDSNIVASSDVVNARLEVVAQGDASESSKRTWLQRVMNSNLSVW
ncbi:flagellar basal body L-ring protein FlgH [Rhodoferax sp. GW822-FHT02A01]|uniref:flagellar basal body L-ring protein FlgH n=1 Tax=Rhodoferax sp. GW822-FHT02A01 TaxID=3141537 RepID=UPI00315C80A5